MIHGIVNVNKEKGFTSHDVVAKLRGITKQKKIGHTGTLDPDATGVLPVCFGKGTKVCDLLTNKEKEYEAVLLLGQETDTQDNSGNVLHTEDTSFLTEPMVEEVIMSFLGTYDQIPPMYSALKINGKKLYELAREGKVVERKARTVEIRKIKIIEMNLPKVRFSVLCSKGTYIRTLCHDIGLKLGCYGCMAQLIRTKVDRFSIVESLTLGEIECLMKQKGNIDDILVSIDTMFEQYTSVTIKEDAHKRIRNGNPIVTSDFSHVEPSTDCWKDGTMIRAYIENEFIGLYQYQSKRNLFKLIKMFATN